ncbi:LamG-like jellyroll fold domain-containing protein [uncultured Polaribacter sp.]|uniref:alpha-L-rhamnosidase-related protein n=1 Tax=uncultured Polaribacter sp. TaxID=174711 RepID=UPI00260B51A5|nr:LamG-like jellyroll fold domain-containing protein [uncultured Polaribacter sp.]
MKNKKGISREIRKVKILLTFSILFIIPITSVDAQSQWIWQQQDGSANTWMAFRKTITIDAVPSEAIVKIAVDSKYWLWINGEMVLFEGGLARGAAPNTTYYDSVDLAPYLKSGENTIAILAWYFGRTRKSHLDSGKGGLYVSADWNADLNTNTSWKMKLHPAYDPNSGGGGDTDNLITPYNIKFDARNALGDWTDNAWYTVVYNDSNWDVPVEKGGINSQPWGNLVERAIPQWNDRGLTDYPSMTVNGSSIQLPYTNNSGSTKTIKAKLPFNQQVTPYIKLNATSGKTIVIDTDNRQNQIKSTYISKSGIQKFEGYSWFNGHVVEYSIPSGVEVQELKYRWTGVGDMTGNFESNDEFYNRLWWMARNTLYICARDGYMDCPDRERALWIGDVGDQTGAIFYTLDEAGRKLLKKAIDNTINYRRGDIIEGLTPGFGSFQTKTAEFAAQSLQFIDNVVWQYYYNTGDKATIENAYPAILTYLKLWNMASDGMPENRKGGVNWTDWGSDRDGDAIRATWYYIALKAAKKMAIVLDKNEDIPWYDNRINSMKQNYVQKYWRGSSYNTSGKPIEERVSSLAVIAGLSDETHYQTLVDEVLFPIRKSSPHFEWLAEEALMQLGHPEKALTRMKEVYDFQVDNPNLTTLYERFENDPKDNLGTPNHAWNAPNYILSRYITGIKATEVAWASYEVCPTMANLTSFKTTVPSVKGDIFVEVAAGKNNFNLKLESPQNTKAVVGIPKTNTEIFEVTVGGVTVWKDGAFVNGVQGITFNSEDESFIKFNVTPGVWDFNANVFVDYNPEISFTTPTDGAIFEKADNDLKIELNATDDEGIEKVELFLDDQLIATKTAAPFSFSSSDTSAISDLEGGDYVLLAKVTDTDGKSSETSITISILDRAGIFTNKLLFYYPLEENGNDESGNGNNATMGSAVTYDNGKYGKGGVFRYTQGSYFTSADKVFEYSSEIAYTIAFWLKVSDYTTRGDILQPTNGRTLLYSNGTDLSFRSSHQKKSISFNVDNNEKDDWFHVALIIDQREGQRQHKFYINGQQRGSIAQGYEFETDKPKSIGRLIFGSFSATQIVRNFTGMLDEVYMFNDVLSETQIQEVMNIEDLEEYLNSLSVIENSPLQDKIKLYPNPAHQMLTILGTQMLNAKVYDLSGRMIKSTRINNNSLDVSSFNNGVYIIKMKDIKGNSYMSKFIKQ